MILPGAVAGTGGGSPAITPLVSADFKADPFVGSINGVSKTAAEILEPDSDWMSGGDLANIQPGVGLVAQGPAVGQQGFHFTTAVNDLIAAGNVLITATTEFVYVPDRPEGMEFTFYHMSEDGWQALDAYAYSIDDGGAGSITGPGISSVPVPAFGAVSPVKFVLLFKAGVLALSINGGDVIETEVCTPSTPFTRFAFNLTQQTSEPDENSVSLTSIEAEDGTDYTAADLPALSA